MSPHTHIFGDRLFDLAAGLGDGFAGLVESRGEEAAEGLGALVQLLGHSGHVGHTGTCGEERIETSNKRRYQHTRAPQIKITGLSQLRNKTEAEVQT